MPFEEMGNMDGKDPVMNLEKSFAFKKFKEELAIRYGKEKADEIWQSANQECTRLEKEETGGNKSVNGYVYPAVSLYRAIEKYASGEALEATRAYGTKFGKRLKGIFSRITSIPGVPTLMWKNMDKIAAKMSSGYDCKNVEVGDGRCFMDITRCPLYDRAKELGTPEAVQMICCMDKEYMTGFRGVDYKRTKSVAEGDDCCDYRLRDSRKKH